MSMCISIDKNRQRTEMIEDFPPVLRVNSASSDANIQCIENFYPPEFGNPRSMPGNLIEDQRDRMSPLIKKGLRHGRGAVEDQTHLRPSSR